MIRKPMNFDLGDRIFIAICRTHPDGWSAFPVYLVNNTDSAINCVAVSGGGWASVDSDDDEKQSIIKTTGKVKKLDTLQPRTYLHVDTLDTGMLDFMNFYSVSFIDTASNTKQLHFTCNKYEPAWDDYCIDVPIVGKRGYVLL